MIRASCVGKRHWFTLSSLIWVLSGCTPLRRAVPPEALPKRVVLALDGLDYRDVLDARQRGRFAAFHEPARLISTFPSISDIAWHAIFGVNPPPGYQRVYYSTRHRRVLGDALSAIRPIEYEERMDQEFDTKFHHLGAYLISWPVARKEVDTDVAHVLRSRGRETVYLYNVGPDALQHTRGDIARYLDHLSDRLDTLQQRYRQRTGRSLNIVVLSDHGHNRARDAAFVPIAEALAAHGFETASALDTPNRVAFSVDGVTTGFGVFCHPDSVARVAALLTTVPGVEVVTAHVARDRFTVSARRADGSVDDAIIEEMVPPAGDKARYRYLPQRGDPLELAGTVRRLQAAGLLDANGYAPESVWVRETASHRYPAAIVRIVHGHVGATQNPAPVLVSVADDHRVGLGMVSVANRMRPLGGTHGALGATNALGVVLSNGVVPHDDVAWRVREQFGGFGDLKPRPSYDGTLQVVTGQELRRDRFVQRAWPQWSAMPDTGAVVVLTLPRRLLDDDPRGRFLRFDVRVCDQSSVDGRLVRSVAVPLAQAWRSSEERQVALPAGVVGLTALDVASDLTLRVVLEVRRPDKDGWVMAREQTVLSMALRVAPDRIPWSY
ncbi:MAG: hypothetical protein ACK57A_05345 [Gemmatimonas sp.]|uniref:hypothetical protein n=1 Tax=Gemmatimonas sp. TaxID=1962908 RepID=UPI00391F59BA